VPTLRARDQLTLTLPAHPREIGRGGLYLYADADPILFVDPEGLAVTNFEDRFGGGGGGGFAGARLGGGSSARGATSSCCPSPQGVGNVGPRPKPINLPSAKRIKIDMEHVQSEHMVGGSRAVQRESRKTTFPENMSERQVERAIRDAYANCERIETVGSQVIVRGVSRDGLTIQMRVDTQTGTILTAFPIY